MILDVKITTVYATCMVWWFGKSKKNPSFKNVAKMVQNLTTNTNSSIKIFQGGIQI